ncbi:MAG: ribonuclease HI [Spirochaetaceae bacterium]|nr:MAG: ribonuclease HI [Spirochaetaceae bacterium]
MIEHFDFNKRVRVHTDGGCHGNPGPGAWAYVVELGSGTVEDSGYDPSTTNNRMELTAVIKALAFIRSRFEGPDMAGSATLPEVEVYTDSRYVQQGITSWIESWERNGWKTSAKKPVKNQELWRGLRELQLEMKPRWSWVRGHAGNPLNERCDELVQIAIAQKK